VSTLVETGHANRSTFAELVLGAVVGALRLVVFWMEIRAARRLLQSMPDGILSDIGISRGSIDHATAFGRDATERPDPRSEAQGR
jgi:uncharacterized protein YjiS (DUF1127 family)